MTKQEIAERLRVLETQSRALRAKLGIVGKEKRALERMQRETTGDTNR